MNPFTDQITFAEERIIDKTLRHLRQTKRERLDALIATTVAQLKREVTLEEFELQVCRIYLKIYREELKKGRKLSWESIHDAIGRTPG